MVARQSVGFPLGLQVTPTILPCAGQDAFPVPERAGSKKMVDVFCGQVDLARLVPSVRSTRKTGKLQFQAAVVAGGKAPRMLLQGAEEPLAAVQFSVKLPNGVVEIIGITFEVGP